MCKNPGEQFVSVEDTMGVDRICPTRRAARPRRTHLKSEPAIVAGMAHAAPELAIRPRKRSVDWLGFDR